MDKTRSNHLFRVLRLKSGETVILTDGCGKHVTARIVLEGKHGFFEPQGEPLTAPPPLERVLLVGVLKQAAMDLVLRMGTELGVTRFVPLLTARTSLSRAAAASRLAHWAGITVAAMEQSEQTHLPVVENPVDFADCGALELPERRLLLWARGGSPLESTGNHPAALLVGPEGGFSHEELTLIDQLGFSRCTLGPRILRADTAAITALARL